MTDKDKARIEKAKVKKENAMVIKSVNKRGKLSVQLGESSWIQLVNTLHVWSAC